MQPDAGFGDAAAAVRIAQASHARPSIARVALLLTLSVLSWLMVSCQPALAPSDQPTGSVVPGEESPAAAGAVDLQASMPNPFQYRTRLRFRLNTDGRASLRIHDAEDRLVRQLIDLPMPAGEHYATWDGLDTAGRRAPAGVYVARLVMGEERDSLMMTLVR